MLKSNLTSMNGELQPFLQNFMGILHPIQHQRNKQLLQKRLEEAKYLIQISSKSSRFHPIYDLVRTYTLQIQKDYIFNLALHNKNEERYFIEDSLGVLNQSLYTFDTVEVSPLKKHSIAIDLSKNPALSPLWHPKRLKNTLNLIGRDHNNSFQFDSTNHESTLILPIGVTVVTNGLHSCSTGIFKAEGIIYPESVTDITNIYNVIRFDGNHYRRLENNRIVYTPTIKELGILFEIGRFIMDNNIAVPFRNFPVRY